jgi:DSF synthase
MRPVARPSFTPELLADLAEMQRSIKAMFAAGEQPVRYYVLGSLLPGIFNLGGDLTVLADRIRHRDRASLVRYARACIDVLYNNAVSFNLPVVTVALVQGDALGGGFEAALSCDVIVAEKGARFGLPEVLFNLFPGMGAYSFLARRLGAAKAERMILSGRIYSAEELHDMDLVHVLAEPGQGEQAVHEFVERSGKRHNSQSAVFRVGRRVAPLSYDELGDVTEIWVDAALNLRESDLRKMERLTAAQNRRWSAPRSEAG